MIKFTAFLIDCAVNHRAQMIEEIRADFAKKS